MCFVKSIVSVVGRSGGVNRESVSLSLFTWGRGGIQGTRWYLVQPSASSSSAAFTTSSPTGLTPNAVSPSSAFGANGARQAAAAAAAAGRGSSSPFTPSTRHSTRLTPPTSSSSPSPVLGSSSSSSSPEAGKVGQAAGAQQTSQSAVKEASGGAPAEAWVTRELVRPGDHSLLDGFVSQEGQT